MNNCGKSVLVTGCSSGIGRACALYLARKGFTVFAGVRKESDAMNLRNLALENLFPVSPLDLTRPEQLPAILEEVSRKLAESGQEGLFALVNNAGGGFISPIELMDLGKFRIELETRLTGTIGLLQAFLPLIRKAHGRIVWIVTPGLMPIPFDSSIHACDFAVNNLARTLKIELQPWNIPVIMVRCGTIKTESVERSYRELDESFKTWAGEKSDLYKDALNREVGRWKEYDKKRTDPVKAAKTVYRALTAEKPGSRYRVGYMSGAAAFLELLPQTMTDSILGKR
ncbi:MAG: SDR family NAD(P)-dependent oxidoreductase [Brevinematales bacterium]|jgi:NAD(P)-dependent dehydrogenase (short-subunit alcohol dehydrogenase family)